MIGSRIRIVLLTSFFTFAFSMLFLLLLENYVSAEDVQDVSAISDSSVDFSLWSSVSTYEIVPNFFKIQESAPQFDFETDDSLQKFLHDDYPFNDKYYVPVDLVPIDSNFTANNSKSFKLREEASIQFADMAWHFRDAFGGDKLYIASAYRSSAFQAFMIRQ